MFSKKGQGSLELMLLVGGAIIVSAIVVMLAFTILGSGSNTTNSTWNSVENKGLFDITITNNANPPNPPVPPPQNTCTLSSSKVVISWLILGSNPPSNQSTITAACTPGPCPSPIIWASNITENTISGSGSTATFTANTAKVTTIIATSGSMSCSIAVPVDVVAYPSFESAAYSSVWSYLGGSSGTRDIDSSTAAPNSGSKSMKLSKNNLETNYYNVLYQRVTIKPNTNYTLSVYMKTNITSASTYGCRADVYSNPWPTTPSITGTTDWTRYSFDFTSPNSNTLDVRFVQDGNPANIIGNCWYDAVSLVER